MGVVFLFRGIGPGYYLMAEMGKKQYGWQYKLGFLNGRGYVRRINQINDPQFYPVTFDKIVEKSLLTQHAINTPAMLGHLNGRRGRCCQGYALKSSEDLLALLERNRSVRKLCFKPVSGQGGSGFRAMEIFKKNGALELKDLQSQCVYLVDDFFSELGIENGAEFIIEQYFEQHPILSGLNSTSVNTLRIMVYQENNSRPHCVGAYLRIGREGAVIDNGSAGGISAKIDLASGALCAGTYAHTRAHHFENHPDTGVLIESVKIPFFSEAVTLAISALDVFPGIYYGVFDVAIGAEKPAIIELNARADYVDFSILNVPSKYALA